MTDITMCADRSCMKRKDCFRYRAHPRAEQSFAVFTSIDGICNGYWPLAWSAGGRIRPMGEIEASKVIPSHDPNAARRAFSKVER